MKRPVVALLMNALVLPGLGQLYLGRKGKGIALIITINLLLLAALFLVMKIISPLIGAQLAGNQITPAQIMVQVQPYALWAKLMLAALLGLWGYGLIDLLSAFQSSADE